VVVIRGRGTTVQSLSKPGPRKRILVLIVAWIKKRCHLVVPLAQSFHLRAPGIYLRKLILEIVSLFWIISFIQWVDVPLEGQEQKMEIITILGNLWYAHIC
jgi:hypothetical protein